MLSRPSDSILSGWPGRSQNGGLVLVGPNGTNPRTIRQTAPAPADYAGAGTGQPSVPTQPVADTYGADKSRFEDFYANLRGKGFFGAAPTVPSMGTWTPEMPGANTAAPVPQVDTTAARSAAFGRAKDQVGQTATGALAGLRSVLGARGMLGSGLESRAAAGVVNKGQGELGDVSREGAINDAAAAQRTAEVNYQGALTQRGQDLDALAARNRDRLAARGMDMSAAESALTRSGNNEASRLQAILGLWSAFNRGRQ